MNSSILTSSGSAGLNPYRWNAFGASLGGGANWTPFKQLVSWVPSTMAVIAAEGGGKYPNFIYRFNGAIAGWMVPGAGMIISASVTINGKSYDVSSEYVVKNIDQAAGNYFEVDAPSPHGGRDAVAFTQAFATTNLDSGSGVVPNPSVSLVMQAQKAVFLSGTAAIAPVVDGTNNAPYSIDLPGSTEYVVEAPVGSKFDLGDWYMRANSGTIPGPCDIMVRFI